MSDLELYKHAIGYILGGIALIRAMQKKRFNFIDIGCLLFGTILLF